MVRISVDSVKDMLQLRVWVCVRWVCVHTRTHIGIYRAKMYFPLGSQAGVLENTGLEESLQDSAGKARGV